jgi:hypothetical protein
MQQTTIRRYLKIHIRTNVSFEVQLIDIGTKLWNERIIWRQGTVVQRFALSFDFKFYFCLAGDFAVHWNESCNVSTPTPPREPWHQTFVCHVNAKTRNKSTTILRWKFQRKTTRRHILSKCVEQRPDARHASRAAESLYFTSIPKWIPESSLPRWS